MSDDADALAALAAEAAAVPYHERLGIVVEELVADRVALRIPFCEGNANPGSALHGGVYASAIVVAGTLAAASGIAAPHGLERRTLDLSVIYLAAAIGRDVVAEARVLRRGKELAYAEVEVRDDAGKPLARGLVTHRFAPPAAAQRVLTDFAAADLEPQGETPKVARIIVRAPFMAARGMQITRMLDGRSLVEMPGDERNAGEGGVVHEGAIAALLDTAGAMAAWSCTAMDLRSKASTTGLHLSFHAPARGDLVAAGHTLSRSDESFLNEVTVYERAGGRAVATGSVTYRIVEP